MSIEPYGDPEHRARKGRSPSYPAINLKSAIERARVLYERERQHPAPIGAITTHWGFASHKTGPASTTYAALKKFGLLEEEGSGSERRGRLTDLGLATVRSPDPQDAIRRAALNPPIHRELWEQFGRELPSDDNLIWTLLQRGFTENGAKDFVWQYRQTIAFAGLESTPDPEDATPSTDLVSLDEAADEPDQPAAFSASAQPPTAAGAPIGVDAPLRIPVPLIGGGAITVEGHFPVSEAAWAQFLVVLEALKPGLTE